MPQPSVAFGRRALGLVVAALFITPLCLQGIARLLPVERVQPSYLPSLEASRPRLPFRTELVDQLRYQRPRYIFIGDSMLGTRIDPAALTLMTDSEVTMLEHGGTGPAWWYLALKNYVIPSQAKPRVVFVFFRDTNLTDTLFRATGNFRWALDQVAREREVTLDAIIASRLNGDWHAAVERVNRFYGVDRLLPTVDTLVRRGPMRLFRPDTEHEYFEHELNTFFGLDELRPFSQADLEAESDRMDFETEVQTSVLPEMLRLAKGVELSLCFVRVQRRPLGRRPPPQSPELQDYLTKLEGYLRANGADYYDEHGDPDLPEAVYADGDHIRREFRERYTERFHQKLDRWFR